MRKRVSTVALVIATFLNPLGFDVVQMVLIDLTGSYSGANLVLYCLSALFFGLYFYLSGNYNSIRNKFSQRR